MSIRRHLGAVRDDRADDARDDVRARGGGRRHQSLAPPPACAVRTGVPAHHRFHCRHRGLRAVHGAVRASGQSLVAPDAWPLPAAHHHQLRGSRRRVDRRGRRPLAGAHFGAGHRCRRRFRRCHRGLRGASGTHQRRRRPGAVAAACRSRSSPSVSWRWRFTACGASAPAWARDGRARAGRHRPRPRLPALRRSAGAGRQREAQRLGGGGRRGRPAPANPVRAVRLSGLPTLRRSGGRRRPH